MSRRWTKDEDLFIKEHYPDEGAKHCAIALDRTETAVRTRAFNLGIKNINGFATKHTHEWYEAELFRKEIDHFPLEKYAGYDTPIKHECLNGHITYRAPNNVLRGSDCIECLGLNKRSPDSYLDDLLAKNIMYTPLEPYIDTDTSILHRCPNCTTEWKARPSHILRGHGCPKCKRPGGYSFTFFENYPEKGSIPGICYLVVLIDKESKEKIAYKIGVTKGTSNKDVLKSLLRLARPNLPI